MLNPGLQGGSLGQELGRGDLGAFRKEFRVAPSTPAQGPVLALLWSPVRSTVACMTTNGLGCCVSLLRAELGCCHLVPERTWGQVSVVPGGTSVTLGQCLLSEHQSQDRRFNTHSSVCPGNHSIIFLICFSSLMLASCPHSGRRCWAVCLQFPDPQSTGCGGSWTQLAPWGMNVENSSSDDQVQ